MNAEALTKLVKKIAEKRVLVLGDVMLDKYVWGQVCRISPEAPVPVVRVNRESIFPGGAANVARNLVPFSARPCIVGRIGADVEGEILRSLLREEGINVDGMLEEPEYLTIAKTRIIAQQQQVVRFDHEMKKDMAEGNVHKVGETAKALFETIDAVIIEDYGKGFITQSLVDAVVPAARAAGLVVTIDPNPANPLDWRGATAVKPNRREAFIEVGMSPEEFDSQRHPMDDAELLEVGRRLLEKWQCEVVPVTLGNQGMMVFQRDCAPHHIPTKAREVFDVSGAGDTAIALFTLALTAGESAVEAAEIANHASGVVVGKLGTATLTPNELIAGVSEESNPNSEVVGAPVSATL